MGSVKMGEAGELSSGDDDEEECGSDYDYEGASQEVGAAQGRVHKNQGEASTSGSSAGYTIIGSSEIRRLQVRMYCVVIPACLWPCLGDGIQCCSHRTRPWTS